MYRLETRTFWIVTVLLTLLLTYIFAASVLLRSIDSDIDFTRAELKGLEEYDALMPVLFEQYGNKDNELAAVRRQIREVGDRSNLILDPSLESYYKVDLLLNQIPWMQQEDKTAQLEHVRGILLNSPSSHEVIPIIDRILATGVEDASVDSMRELAKVTSVSLRSVLQQREKDLNNHRALSALIIMGFFVLTTAMMGWAIKNYITRREIDSTREKIKLTRQLELKNQELERLTYIAAHDLKEPVRTMRCYAALLKDEWNEGNKESAENYIGVIENTSARAEKMINDLLLYATLDFPVQENSECVAQQEVEAVLNDMKASLDPVQMEIHVGNLPIIPMIPSMFARVMINLIDNAVRYRNPDRTLVINISAEKETDSWVFAVTDNGSGILPEESEKIFEPFRRLQRGAGSQGTGIGLASCKKIVENSGGSIWAMPVATGGLSLRFRIPVARDLQHHHTRVAW